MVAVTGNTRVKRGMVGSGVMALINQPVSEPQYEYREVGVGGRLEDIRLADQVVDGKFIQGQKIGEKWVGQTIMQLRDVSGHSNQLGWWIPELGREIIFEYFSLSNIYRAEMIERLDPAYKLLGDWLAIDRDSKAAAIVPINPNAPIPDDWMERLRQSADNFRTLVTVFEAVLKAVTVSPAIVDSKADEASGGVWVKRFSEERLLQLWTFLNSDLYRVQDYFRQARG